MRNSHWPGPRSPRPFSVASDWSCPRSASSAQAQEQVESLNLRAPPSSPRVPLAGEFTPRCIPRAVFQGTHVHGEYKSPQPRLCCP